MQTTIISINRALTNIKNLKKELDTYLATKRPFLGIAAGDAGTITNHAGYTSDKLIALLQSNYDTGASLIKRIATYKQKIIASNAFTMVNVNGVEMTVSDAIVMKATLVEREKFLKLLKQSKIDFKGPYDDAVTEFNKRVEAVFNASVQVDSSKEEKMALLETVTNQQKTLVGPKVVDPNNLDQKIADMEKEINFLKNELDYVLSTSNTVTMIEVEA